MTDIVERAELALTGVSRGPWRMGNRRHPEVVHTPHGCLWHPDLGQINNVNDGLFIAAARDLIPELVAEVKGLRAKYASDYAEFSRIRGELVTELTTLKAEMQRAIDEGAQS